MPQPRTGPPGRRRGPGGIGRPRGPGWWLAPLARHKWYSALGIGASLALIAGGVLAVLPHRPAATAHDLAEDCGLVKCSATLPASATSPGATARSGTARRGAASPSPGRTGRQPSSASPAASSRSLGPPYSGAPSRPDVTVTYTPGSDPHGAPGQRFEGHLTIVNHGTAPVGGWTLQLTFPGDTFVWIGYHGHGSHSFDAWHASGDSVVLHAVSASETLPPGGSQQVVIEAEGTSTAPTWCSFDGAACLP